MKTYKNIQEWINSDPAEEEISKVLKLVNRSLIQQAKQEMWQKESHLRKMVKTVDSLKSLKLSVPKEYEATIKELRKELDDIKKALPTPVKKVKKEA